NMQIGLFLIHWGSGYRLLQTVSHQAWRGLGSICSVFILSLGVVEISTGWAGKPVPWQMGMQQPATPVMERIYHLHDILLWITGAIALFVGALLIYVLLRFRASKNPTPSTQTHHTLLEVIWTAIPTVILVALAIPSLKLLYFMDKAVDPQLTVKVVGHQWYWSYDYPDHQIAFDSLMVDTKDLQPDQLRLLDVDNPLIVPVGTVVRVLLTSADVIHSWALPALGIKKDTVPGKLTETWFQIKQEGVYYGQCSEICGINHGFMPIVVKAIPREQFAQWLELKKKTAHLGDRIKMGESL
ncbi:MAG: cytochrome c oxidase subunit II, partial [Alphaproteobacteria bacterium]